MRRKTVSAVEDEHGFPFLLGGTFIEARVEDAYARKETTFPFLLGRAFIEAQAPSPPSLAPSQNFPSFWEGLSLRLPSQQAPAAKKMISLPFGKGFH